MKTKNDELFQKKKEEILLTAEALILEHGIEGVSMRKLASSLEMTPGIFYHYFKNKEEVLAGVVLKGYGEILSIIRLAGMQANGVEEQLTHTFTCYIEGMLQRKELYQIMMNASYSVIFAQTKMLHKGISKERQSIQALCSCIEQGVQEGLFETDDVELSAQCMWCSIFGLLDRLIKEDIQGEQKERLIQQQTKMVLNSIRKRT